MRDVLGKPVNSCNNILGNTREYEEKEKGNVSQGVLLRA